MSNIQAEFDRIALVGEQPWNNNTHYHDFLLRQLPSHCENALDIGCGTGTFARLLADRSDHVLGLDFSPKMIEIARECSSNYAHLDYQIADVTSWAFPPAQFEVVASIATLHHMDLELILRKIKDTFKVNGVLVVLDLFQNRTIADTLTSILALPLHYYFRTTKLGNFQESPEARAAWEEHGKGDKYLTLAQVRQVCSNILPGAKVQKHLFWRYSIVWQKPG